MDVQIHDDGDVKMDHVEAVALPELESDSDDGFEEFQANRYVSELAAMDKKGNYTTTCSFQFGWDTLFSGWFGTRDTYFQTMGGIFTTYF
jgi:hypothetical protein